DMSALTTPMVRVWVFSNNTNDEAQNTLKLLAFDGSSWVEIGSYAGNNPDWVKLDVPVPTNIPNPAQFQLSFEVGTGAGSEFYNDLLVDDFSVIEAPECVAPADLAVLNFTLTSADFSWTPSVSAPTNGYEWEVYDVNENLAASGSTMNTTASSGTLPTDADYTVQVRSVCGGGSTSSWSLPVSFHLGYCIPTGSVNNSDEILNFTLSNLNNASTPSEGTAGYSDYTGTVAPAQLVAGSAYV